MVKDDKISQAKAEIEKAQENLLDTYFTQIKKGYKSLEPRQRKVLLGNLDFLTQRLEKGNLIEGLALRTVRKNLAYDGEKARKIREEAGLSREKLVQELGISRTGYAELARYESGNTNPSNPPRGKTSKKYVEWLKEKGYNPFKL